MFGRPGYLALSAIMVIAIIAGLVPSAYAHPINVGSSPKPFSGLSASPQEVVVNFSEPIELSYSSISVLGPNGGRVDANQAYYANGDTATIAVGLQPNLPEGIYTVTTKVLSSVDGHVVDGAFTFGVGTTPTGPGSGGQAGTPSKILSPAESSSRFPGMVGQVIVVGAAFGSLWLWRPLEKVASMSGIVATKKLAFHKSMIRLVFVGTAVVLASNVAIIVVQAVGIGAGVSEAIATKFGMVWTTRMIESSILMMITIFVWRKMARSNAPPSKAEILAILVMGLAVLVTSSLIAHGAATGQVAAILLDFFHNVAASIWIGGLILMGFVAVPAILSLADERLRSAAISILIPRFSTIVVTILGLAIITGPLLLFLLEPNLSLTLASTYGKILAIKLGLAGVMVAMGAYSQFVIQKKAALVMAGGASAVDSSSARRFAKSLKAEAGVGIALLFMVSLMANGALPAGEFPQSQQQEPQQPQAAFADKPVPAAFKQTIYTPAGRADLSINPFVVGQNKFTVSFFGTDGKLATDVGAAKIKLTQVEKNIGPIAVDLKKDSGGVFSADAAFSLPGRWAMDIEGVRPQSSNIVASLDVTVRPSPSSLSFDVKEYRTPEKSLPLFPVFDAKRQSIWAGDSLPGTGRMWQLDMQTGKYIAHQLQNVSLVTQSVLDPSGKLWYIDPLSDNAGKLRKLGLYDPDSKTNRLFYLPVAGVPSGIAQDHDGNLWVPIVDANQVVKFSPSQESFTRFDIPTPQSRPVGIAVDNSGTLWMAESAGKIASIDPATGSIQEFEPKGTNKLVVPTAVFPSPDGTTIYIAEHDGNTVTAFNTLFQTFREYPTLNRDGLPFGMALDSFGNLWYAQHEVDRLGVIDPRTGQGTEAPIPTAGSFVQWITPDDKGRIWFAEQRGAAIGVVTITAKPQASPPSAPEWQQPASGPAFDIGLSFADVVGPAIAAGIILSALFYAKSALDLKRNMRMAEKLPA